MAIGPPSSANSKFVEPYRLRRSGCFRGCTPLAISNGLKTIEIPYMSCFKNVMRQSILYADRGWFFEIGRKGGNLMSGSAKRQLDQTSPNPSGNRSHNQFSGGPNAKKYDDRSDTP